MTPFTQRGDADEVEVKHRKVTASTKDSPDSSIESRKKRTGIIKIIGPITGLYFDLCFNHCFVIIL
jgi:hypothetical protein